MNIPQTHHLVTHYIPSNTLVLADFFFFAFATHNIHKNSLPTISVIIQKCFTLQGKPEPEMNTQPSQMNSSSSENGCLRDKVLILDAGSQYGKVRRKAKEK